VAFFEAPNDAADELALAVLVLVVDDVALGIANALEQDLLGRLRRDAAEGAARLLHVEHGAELLVLLLGALGVLRMPENLEPELLADLGLETVLAGDVHGDLALGERHRLDDGHVLEEIDVAGVRVVPGLELAVRAERRLRGLQDRRLHGFDQNLLVDALLLGHLLDDCAETVGRAECMRCCHGYLLRSSAESFCSRACLSPPQGAWPPAGLSRFHEKTSWALSTFASSTSSRRPRTEITSFSPSSPSSVPVTTCSPRNGFLSLSFAS
jgi:hypothetical protein